MSRAECGPEKRDGENDIEATDSMPWVLAPYVLNPSSLERTRSMENYLKVAARVGEERVTRNHPGWRKKRPENPLDNDASQSEYQDVDTEAEEL